MSESQVWLGRGLVPAHQALVPVTDRGFLAGDGVFETLKVVARQPFALTRHLQRLDNSLGALRLVLPADIDLRCAVTETIAANPDICASQARLRITVTAGTAAGMSRGGGDPTVVIAVEPQVPHPPAARLVTVPWPHNERGPLVGAKTTSYASNLAILERVRAAGSDEALMPDTTGRLCEGTTCNVVVAVGGELITPTLETGCLPGVTRDLILEWGIAAERDIPFAELGAVDEVLLSSSTRDLLPAVSLDGRELPAPGPLGRAAIAEFAARAAQSIDP